MKTINASSIIDTQTACYFCGDPWKEDSRGCCGEHRPAEVMFTEDGEYYYEGEVIVDDDLKERKA
jgi:hypothetical protein